MFSISGVAEMILKVLDGYNASIIAYGCTGTGKTYTINGSEEFQDEGTAGIVPRAIDEFFL